MDNKKTLQRLASLPNGTKASLSCGEFAELLGAGLIAIMRDRASNIETLELTNKGKRMLKYGVD